jgi:hypothetical protein
VYSITNLKVQKVKINKIVVDAMLIDSILSSIETRLSLDKTVRSLALFKASSMHVQSFIRMNYCTSNCMRVLASYYVIGRTNKDNVSFAEISPTETISSRLGQQLLEHLPYVMFTKSLIVPPVYNIFRMMTVPRQ